MPTTLNKVTLLGHVGTEPEIHHFEKELTLCKFRLATNDFFTEKSTGEKKELTDWHTIISWGEQAKQIQSKLKKGQHIYLEGKLKPRKWKSKEGHVMQTCEIHLSDYILIENHIETKKEELPYSSEGIPSQPSPLSEFNSTDLDTFLF
jgi:single-strand DNA-binding protein